MFKKQSYYLPTLRQSWILLLFLILGSIFAELTSYLLLLIFPESGFIKNILAYILIFLPVFLYVNRKGKKIFNEAETSGEEEAEAVKMDAPNFGRLNPILFFILISISILALTVAVDPLVSWIEVPEWYKEAIMKILEGNMIYAFISMAILPALLEEWFNRGVITRGLLKHLSPTKAIIWSAFIFAVMHFNLLQGIPCFFIGCFLGWIYYNTRSIWTVIFLHFVNNAFFTISYYAFPEIPMDCTLADLLPNQATYWLLVATSIGLITLTIFIIDKYIKPAEISPPL